VCEHTLPVRMTAWCLCVLCSTAGRLFGLSPVCLGLDNDRDEAPRRRSMRHAGNDRRFPFEDGMVQN
jgi:hypothetical protein